MRRPCITRSKLLPFAIHTSHTPLQIAVNLGKDGYLPEIVKATDDINVQIVFCNAGYLLTGFFHNR